MSTPVEVGGKDEIQHELEEGPGRYAAYLLRIKTLIKTSSRYIAYSSDIGEAFRPLTHPGFVRGAYALSWAYIGGDCIYAGYKAHQAHQQATSPLAPVSNALAESAKALEKLTPAEKVELRKRQFDIENDATLSSKHSETINVGLVVARRAVFQSIASMALPAFTIHSIVRYSAPLFAKSASPRIRSAGPTVAGLAFVPALPFIFDEPVEHVIDAVFDYGEAAFFGEEFKRKKEHAKEELSKAEESLKENVTSAASSLTHLLPSRDVSSKNEGSSSLIAKAAILGIGVDVLYLPRLRSMLHRQALRMAAASKRRPGVMGRPSDTLRSLAMPATVGAGLRLAERIGSANERAQFRSAFVTPTNQSTVLPEKALRWLALRWTAKEAAYKALFPHIRLGWGDLEVSKIPTENDSGANSLAKSGLFGATEQGAKEGTGEQSSSASSQERVGRKPILSFSPAFAKTWKAKQRDVLQQQQAQTTQEVDRKRIDLHLSISHDGDICTANVLAELVDATQPQNAIDAEYLYRRVDI